MKKKVYFLPLLAAFMLYAELAAAQAEGADMASAAMHLWKAPADSGSPARWTYEEGVVWRGLEETWLNTGDARYFRYIQQWVDRLVDKEGQIATYKKEDYNLDNIMCGRLVLMLYKVTNQEKYYKAARLLRQQLLEQPRTSEGGFWHKKKYTEQVWLDGLYMAQPFYAEYASLFHEDTVYDDVVRQFAAIEGHVRDPAPDCCIMDGMSRGRNDGRTNRTVILRISGPARWAGTGWRW